MTQIVYCFIIPEVKTNIAKSIKACSVISDQGIVIKGNADYDHYSARHKYVYWSRPPTLAPPNRGRVKCVNRDAPNYMCSKHAIFINYVTHLCTNPL